MPNNRVPTSTNCSRPCSSTSTRPARRSVRSALCSGNDAEASRWSTLSTRPTTCPWPSASNPLASHHRSASNQQAPTWNLSSAGRATDRSGGGPSVQPLPVWTVRLLAVVTLDADIRAGDVIETLEIGALTGPCRPGAKWRVLDLVDKFGTTPIGERGFHRALRPGCFRPTTGPARTPGLAGEPRGARRLHQVPRAYADAADLLRGGRQPARRRPVPRRPRAPRPRWACPFLRRSHDPRGDAFRQAFEIAPPESGDAEEALLAVDPRARTRDQGPGLGVGRRGQVHRRATRPDRALFSKTFPSPTGASAADADLSGLLSPDDACASWRTSARFGLYPAARRRLRGRCTTRCGTLANGAGCLAQVPAGRRRGAVDRSANRRRELRPAEQKAAASASFYWRVRCSTRFSGDTPDQAGPERARNARGRGSTRASRSPSTRGGLPAPADPPVLGR